MVRISIVEEDLKEMIVTVTLATVPFTAEEEGILIQAVVVEVGEDAVLVGLTSTTVVDVVLVGLIATSGVEEGEDAVVDLTATGVEEGEVGDITMIEEEEETSVEEGEVGTLDEILLSVVWMVDEILLIEVWMMIIDEILPLEGWTIVITVYQLTIIIVEKEKLSENYQRHVVTHTEIDLVRETLVEEDAVLVMMKEEEEETLAEEDAVLVGLTAAAAEDENLLIIESSTIIMVEIEKITITENYQRPETCPEMGIEIFRRVIATDLSEEMNQ